MKTPMQEHIEWLKERYKYYSSEWEMDIVAGLGYAIDHAEEMLEEEEDYHKRMREIVAQELHNLGMLTDRAIDQAAFESEYGYSSTNYNSFKEGVKWLEGQLTEYRKQFKIKEK